MEYPNISTDVRKLIADKIANNEPVQISWLTHEIIERNADIDGEDKPFYLVCANAHVKNIVRSCIGKYDQKSIQNDRQIVMDGFEHLQIAYTMTRGGVTVLIPVNQLSDAELRHRANEYREMSKGCVAHADEIDMYLSARTEVA